MKRILTLTQTIPGEDTITFGVIEVKKNGLHNCRIVKYEVVEGLYERHEYEEDEEMEPIEEQSWQDNGYLAALRQLTLRLSFDIAHETRKQAELDEGEVESSICPGCSLQTRGLKEGDRCEDCS